jgi:hypothetical protein
MISTVHLDDASVNAVAERVAELLRGESIEGELVDAAEVARRFSVSRDFVYYHADELSVIRLGNGSRARQRFDPVVVRERLTQMTVRDPEKKPRRENRNPVRRGGSSDLLPIKGD